MAGRSGRPLDTVKQATHCAASTNSPSPKATRFIEELSKQCVEANGKKIVVRASADAADFVLGTNFQGNPYVKPPAATLMVIGNLILRSCSTVIVAAKSEFCFFNNRGGTQRTSDASNQNLTKKVRKYGISGPNLVRLTLATLITKPSFCWNC